MTSEQWLNIPGFPAYQVSAAGRVRSTHGAGRVLKPMMTGSKGRQYETVMLCNGENTRVVKVHLLVLEMFVGPKPAGCIGCHRDDNKMNNTVENLYWGTAETNARDRVRNGHHSGQKLSVEQVSEIRRRRCAGERGVDLAKEFNVSQQVIWNVYSRRTGGYIE